MTAAILVKACVDGIRMWRYYYTHRQRPKPPDTGVTATARRRSTRRALRQQQVNNIHATGNASPHTNTYTHTPLGTARRRRTHQREKHKTGRPHGTTRNRAPTITRISTWTRAQQNTPATVRPCGGDRVTRSLTYRRTTAPPPEQLGIFSGWKHSGRVVCQVVTGGGVTTSCSFRHALPGRRPRAEIVFRFASATKSRTITITARGTPHAAGRTSRRGSSRRRHAVRRLQGLTRARRWPPIGHRTAEKEREKE